MPETERAGLHQRLAERFGPPVGDALYTFGAGAVAITVSGLAAHWLRQPLLFPSLGPTVYLFFETPLAENASPRNTLIGHGVALLAGLLSLAVFGLMGAPSVLQVGVSIARIGAAALSVALTGAVLMLLRSPHPPAGATTLIVSLGLIATLPQMGALAVGVLLLTLIGWLLNRALGVPVPAWAEPATGKE